MSYDLYLKDKDTGETIQLKEPHQMKGGTYAIGGSKEAHLNITYNYGHHFVKALGEKGIRTIYGMTGSESMVLLEKAIYLLGNDVDEDYWKPTEGNAKQALMHLLILASMCPNGLWTGD